MEKKDIRAYTYEQLQEELSGIGEKAFRGKQIYEWLHVRLADSFDEMTNLSKALREKLEAQYVILPVEPAARQELSLIHIFPACVFAACYCLGVSRDVLGVSVLLTAMPAGATTSILAEKYGMESEFATKMVVVSTCISLLTICFWSTILK